MENKAQDKKEDKLILGGHEFNSRFILGSGKYNVNLIKAAVEQGGAEIITLALRRANTENKENILDFIPKGVTLLPNTSGARNAEEAVRIARGALSDLGSAVEEIEIPANITNIQPGAFVGLSNLGWIEADAANPAYVTVDGVLYTADGTVLLAFPAAWTGTFQVPETVKSFAESAFDGTNLECIDARSCTLEQAGSIPETVKLLE